MSKFKVGDKVVPVSKSAKTSWGEWLKKDKPIPNFFKEKGFLYVEVIEDGKVALEDEQGRGDKWGDWFLESDLIPYVEKPINHCPQNKTVYGLYTTTPDFHPVTIQTIFNGPATVCIIKYDDKQFKGIAKCNPADTYDEAIGHVIASERAAIELSKYRISQAVR